MIIHDPKIIFIHVPKTGGTTIDRLLAANKAVGEPDSGFGAHHRLSQLYNKYMGPNTPKSERRDLSEYHMFTVARNPWERYASLYIHDKFAWQGIPKNRKRTFVPIEEYIFNNVSENFFRAIEVNGAIPDNLMIMDFEDIRNEIKRVFTIMGLRPGIIFHENKKTKHEKTLQREIVRNTVFQDAVRVMCETEISLFNYELPEGAI